MGHHNPTAMLSQTMHSYLMVGQSAGAQRNKVWLLPPVISKMETHWRHWHQHFPVTASTASAPSHPVRSAGASRLIMLCAVITGTRQCQGHDYWHQAVPGPQLLAPGHNCWHQATITSTRTQSRPQTTSGKPTFYFIMLYRSFSCFFMLFHAFQKKQGKSTTKVILPTFQNAWESG